MGRTGHEASAEADAKYISVTLALILGFIVVEVVAAIAGHSLALIADAGHMLTDAGALIASLAALRLARRPASGAWTFGFKRAEILSAQGNGITLLVVAALVATESIRRLIDPHPVRGGVVLTVALAGVVVNVMAAWTLGKASRDSINVKGALQHILTDLYAFIGTVIAAVVILITGFARADAIASLVVVMLMLRAAWGLLRETGRVLLEAAPVGYEPKAIVDDIRANAQVASVHDLHVWLITSGFPALSAHVLVKDPTDCHAVRQELEEMLTTKHHIAHTTLQVDHVATDLLTIGRRSELENEG